MSTLSVDTAATVLIGSDRYSASVIKRTPMTVTVRYDRVIAGESHEYHGPQAWVAFDNPKGDTLLFRLDGEGRPRRRSDGYRLLLGRRDHYSDPSF